MVSLTPKYTIPDGTYEVHPDLPDGVTIDLISGIISGTPTEVILKRNTATPPWRPVSPSTSVLRTPTRTPPPPEDYPEDGELVNLDDDGDGASDLSETGTGIYNGADDLGTIP